MLVLLDYVESPENDLLADEMIVKFLETTIDICKEIKAIDLEGSSFHCLQYIKNLFHEKHMTYKNIKPLADCSDIDNDLNQFTLYNIYSFKLSWKGLKKLVKPRYSFSHKSSIMDKNSHELFTSID
ncbi:hypothetical protein PIROE2DRAFT_4601 [Piromyces sp. E2]|nr:hypothetical protein PIROE2DRAFT_4601 [Piromyces sp. E2]|eukprot:OUM67794.1 hypothetical protein PIROE2DRAFT_4601 [Piromyces sp. E2]